MYRYSRGQPQQSSLPRPAWGSGSGSHGARTASPEPGGLTTGSNVGTPLGGGPAEGSRDRPAEEAILELQTELEQLRNVCALKDQRIAELQRTDIPTARLKRDIRQLTTELHQTRKDLSDSARENQDLRAQLERYEAGGAGGQRDLIDTQSSALGRGAGGDRGSELRGRRIVELEEENRSLRESVRELSKANVQYPMSNPSGASTQRVQEAQLPSSISAAGNAATTAGDSSAVLGGRPSSGGWSQYGQSQPGMQVPGTATLAPAVPSTAPALPRGQEESMQQIVYSSHTPETHSTIGPTVLQGVGQVEGVHMVAKVLLQKMQSSVVNQQLRAMQQANAGALQNQLRAGQVPMT